MGDGLPAATFVPVPPDPAVQLHSIRATAGEGDVIVTSGLTKVYRGARTAVDGLDLKVRKGEIFALLGPNGAGKTTTVGMLTGRVIPTAGTAVVNGVNVAADPGLVKAAVGVVSQLNTL